MSNICVLKGVISSFGVLRGFVYDPLCLVQGTAAGNGSQLLKASCASYTKGLAMPALASDGHK